MQFVTKDQLIPGLLWLDCEQRFSFKSYCLGDGSGGHKLSQKAKNIRNFFQRFATTGHNVYLSESTFVRRKDKKTGALTPWAIESADGDSSAGLVLLNVLDGQNQALSTTMFAHAYFGVCMFGAFLKAKDSQGNEQVLTNLTLNLSSDVFFEELIVNDEPHIYELAIWRSFKVYVSLLKTTFKPGVVIDIVVPEVPYLLIGMHYFLQHQMTHEVLLQYIQVVRGRAALHRKKINLMAEKMGVKVNYICSLSTVDFFYSEPAVVLEAMESIRRFGQEALLDDLYERLCACPVFGNCWRHIEKPKNLSEFSAKSYLVELMSLTAKGETIAILPIGETKLVSEYKKNKLPESYALFHLAFLELLASYSGTLYFSDLDAETGFFLDVEYSNAEAELVRFLKESSEPLSK